LASASLWRNSETEHVLSDVVDVQIMSFSITANSRSFWRVKNMTAVTTEKSMGKCPFYLIWEYSSCQNFSCFPFNLDLIFFRIYFYASEYLVQLSRNFKLNLSSNTKSA
jgi:hypothetical protein